MSVAKRDGNHGEGRHRRVRKGGWKMVRKGGKNSKLEGVWNNGENIRKNGEAIRIWGLKHWKLVSDILVVNQKIYHNLKSAIVVVWFKDDLT